MLKTRKKATRLKKESFRKKQKLEAISENPLNETSTRFGNRPVCRNIHGDKGTETTLLNFKRFFKKNRPKKAT